jgi:NTE family protein
LRDRGFTPVNIAGSSAGAIVGACIAAGYSPEELREIVYEIDFKRFLDGCNWPWQKPWNLFRHWGCYKGDEFEKFMRSLLENKGIFTFNDLKTDREQDKKDPRYKWKLNVIVSDVTNKKMIVLPNDAHYYGVPPEAVDVAKAVRMSMSIPFLFRPIKWRDTIFVDGGMLSNFPIWLFDSDGPPEHPTFGFLLRESEFGQPEEYTGFKSYAEGLVQTMIQAHDRRNVKPGDFEHRTIAIPTGKMSTVDFDQTEYDKQWLYKSGRKAANKFFETWDWNEYQRWAIEERSNGHEGEEE